MNNITVHERPGVYSSYDASSVVSAARAGKTIGLAARGAQGASDAVTALYSFSEGLAVFGKDADGLSGMEKMLEILYANGAREVKAVRVASGAAEDYAAAFALLAECEGIDIMICDSCEREVHLLLSESVTAASEERRERIGIVGDDGAGVADSVARAKEINNERMVLVTAKHSGENAFSHAVSSAAVAAVIAKNADASLPVNGLTLRGIDEISGRYNDAEIDALVVGGVMPLEVLGGEVSIVRGVTTKTKAGEASDATWRELTTILIVDQVIPSIRDALRSRFIRSKNTAQTRSAIRSQVIMELENFLASEYIDSYSDVSVTALESDPTVCLVEFDFTVAHGLSRIYLTAHITV